jgi:hypothetical protein
MSDLHKWLTQKKFKYCDSKRSLLLWIQITRALLLIYRDTQYLFIMDVLIRIRTKMGYRKTIF